MVVPADKVPKLPLGAVTSSASVKPLTASSKVKVTVVVSPAISALSPSVTVAVGTWVSTV